MATGLSPSPSGGGSDALSRRLFIASSAAFVIPSYAAEIKTSPGTLAKIEALDFDGRKVPVPTPGKATIVNFWATWCPPCRAEMPLLQSLPDFYPDKLSLQLVNFKERMATVQRYMRESNSTHAVLFDPVGEGAAKWGVRNFPTTVGFDARGRARWRVRGEYDWSSAEAAKLVEGLWA
jgi:thiol-disulfide isomerase/thioredoxin